MSTEPTYTPVLADADNYFIKHPRNSLWLDTPGDERTGALILAAMDIGSLLPEKKIDDTDPMQLLAVYEQAVFLLEKLNREKNPSVISETIEGIGQRTFANSAAGGTSAASGEFSARALRLIGPFLTARFLRG